MGNEEEWKDVLRRKKWWNGVVRSGKEEDSSGEIRESFFSASANLVTIAEHIRHSQHKLATQKCNNCPCNSCPCNICPSNTCPCNMDGLTKRDVCSRLKVKLKDKRSRGRIFIFLWDHRSSASLPFGNYVE